MNSKELHKQAALAITSLRDDLMEKTSELDSLKESVKLAFDMFNEGVIPAEQLETKIQELGNKSLDDLNIIRKSLEFTKTSEDVGGFRLSEDPGNYSDNSPEDRFFLSLMEDE